jgi:hypothetical protein
MEKLTIKTTNLYTQKKCTGNCADIDFGRQGYIDITFGVYPNRIEVIEYCGVSFNSPTIYWFKPNSKSIKSNQAFLDRLIHPLEDSEAKNYILSLI